MSNNGRSGRRKDGSITGTNNVANEFRSENDEENSDYSAYSSPDTIRRKNCSSLDLKATRKFTPTSNSTIPTNDNKSRKSIADGSASDVQLVIGLHRHQSGLAFESHSFDEEEASLNERKEVVIMAPMCDESDYIKSSMNMTGELFDECMVYTTTMGSKTYYLWENFSPNNEKNDNYMLQLRIFLEKRINCFLFFILPKRSRNGVTLDLLNRVKRMFSSAHLLKITTVPGEMVLNGVTSPGRETGLNNVSQYQLNECFPTLREYELERVDGFKNNVCTMC